MQAGKEVNVAHRERMRALETAMLAEFEPVDFETHHYFANGTYTRTLIIPAGSILTGQIHRYECTNIVAKGRMILVSDEGRREVFAGDVFISGPNTKKGGVALEDSVFINVFPWNGEQDLKVIEASLTIPEERQIEASP